MRATSAAAVMTGPWRSELRQLPIPEVEEFSGIIKVEAAGVCGADVHYYDEQIRSPRVLGHENVGEVVALGDGARDTWSLAVGDRIVLEEYLPCGKCEYCRTTEFRLCRRSDPFTSTDCVRYGSTGLDVAPGLWGGYSEYLYLAPRAVFHRASKTVDAEQLAVSLPIGNGYEWVVLQGGLQPGQSVLIMGPGQQGLGSVIAASAAGAKEIIVTGQARDAARLRVARELGATAVVDVGIEDPIEVVRERTNGRLVDVVVDATGGSEASVATGLQSLRRTGRLLVAGAPRTPLTSFDLRRIQIESLTVQGVRGHSFAAIDWAIAEIERRPERAQLLCSHRFGLAHVDEAIRTVAGRGRPDPIHVVVLPQESPDLAS